MFKGRGYFSVGGNQVFIKSKEFTLLEQILTFQRRLLFLKGLDVHERKQEVTSHLPSNKNDRKKPPKESVCLDKSPAVQSIVY